MENLNLSIVNISTFNSNSLNTVNVTNLNVWLRYQSVMQLLSVHNPTAYFIHRYFAFMWMSLGIPGNILAFVIWIQPRLRTASGFYLAALSLIDLFMLLYKFTTWVDSKYGYYIKDMNGFCQISIALNYMCQYGHTLLILGFSVERCIAIRLPFKKATLCTKSRALKVIALLMGISLLTASPQLYFWHISDLNHCDFRLSVVKGGMLSIIIKWSFVTEILIFVIVPLIALSVNIVVIQTIQVKRQKQLRAVTHFFKHKSLHRIPTFTLLTTSFYDIVAEVSVTVVQIIWPLFKTGNELMSDQEITNDAQWSIYITYRTLKCILDNIFWSRYACNFYIYLITGKTFRAEIKHLICCVFCRSKYYKKDNRSSYLTSTF